MGACKEDKFRKRAADCRRQAERTPMVDIKQYYLDLASHWEFLAQTEAKRATKSHGFFALFRSDS